MEKVLLNSDQEYFQYCVDREVCDISNRLAFIENGEALKYPHIGITTAGETTLVTTKPSHYPCIMVWYVEQCVSYERCGGTFIYYDEF